MKVVILCGGKGTRLREETEFKPKPMVEIGGRPVLWHIMSLYARYGYREFVLPLGYRGEAIKRYFHDYAARHADFTVDLATGRITRHESSPLPDWKVTLCDTGEDTLKGARIKRVARHLDGERFMVTYGDGVADVDLNALLTFHLRSGKLATFTGVRMPSRFGTVRTDAQGSILAWQEKPLLNEYINGGFFVFEKGFLDYLSEDPDCDLEKAPLERLAAEGRLAMYPHDGFWQCMDTLRDAQLLNALWAAGNAPWAGENIRNTAPDSDAGSPRT